MLTDEEIQSVYSEFLDIKGSAMEFARRIERAVLEKVMPKQEPNCWRITHKSFCGLVTDKKEVAEDPFYSGCVYPLYTKPQPAQAAAIPDGWKLVPVGDNAKPMLIALALAAGMKPLNDDDYPITGRQSTVRQWYDAMLSASPKP